MDEKFLHHIWDGLHLNAQLQTVSGKKLRIAYQGQYNTGRGADFLNAGIVIDDYALRGDVEIHKQTSDWHAHNHSDDPFYNNVVCGTYPEELPVQRQVLGIAILVLPAVL